MPSKIKSFTNCLLKLKIWRKKIWKKKSVVTWFSSHYIFNLNFQFFSLSKNLLNKKSDFFGHFLEKKSAFLGLPDIKNGFSDSIPFQTVYFYSHHSNSLKVRPTVFQISKIFGSWHFFKGNKFPGHNTNDERRRKRKKKRGREEKKRGEGLHRTFYAWTLVFKHRMTPHVLDKAFECQKFTASIMWQLHEGMFFSFRKRLCWSSSDTYVI